MHLPANDIPKMMTRRFRILADETRFRLLRLLAKEELSVSELADITQLAQPRISNHLKILREESIISERRQGSWRHYRVDLDELDHALRLMWPAFEEAWTRTETFIADDKRLALVLTSRRNETGLSFFDKLAERWDEFRSNLFGEALGREILRTFLPPDLVVADIGTGTGYALDLFGSKAKKIIAVDNSEAMLAMARVRAASAGLKNVEFRLSDAGEKPLQKNEADLITVIQVLHHLKDPAPVIANLAEGLAPKGRLIINDFLPHQEVWLEKELQHQWLGFERERLDSWLSAAGLILESWEVLPGRNLPDSEGMNLSVPDAFTLVARK